MKSMFRFAPAISTAALVAVSLVAGSSVAAAHERRSLGPYAVEVGWLIEPAYANTANAVFLEVVDTRVDAPVERLDRSMQVEVVVGGGAARRTFAFKAIPQEAGHYQSAFVPTATGDYTFRIFGTIAPSRSTNASSQVPAASTPS